LGAGALFLQIGTIYKYRSETTNKIEKEMSTAEIEEQVTLENEDK